MPRLLRPCCCLLLVASLGGPPRHVQAQARPPAEFVDEGACPFECCTYGRWWATAETHLHARSDSTSPRVGAVVAGDTVVARTGEVRTIPKPFVFRQPMQLSGRDYAAGDTVWALTYLGEGFFRVWDGGEILELDLGFSPYGGTPGRRCEFCEHGELLRELGSRWWIQMSLPDGTVAWTNRPDLFDSEHACG